MDPIQFYGLFTTTCFLLVGLWWTVVVTRSDWHADPLWRGRAGGVLVGLLLPAIMGLGAQISPSTSWWRATFAVTSLVGAATTLRLLIAERSNAGSPLPGPAHRNRWLGAALYGLVFAVSLIPGAGAVTGLSDLQISAFLLGALVLLANTLAWELMTSPRVTVGSRPA